MAQKRVSITVHLVVGKDDDLINKINQVKGTDRAELVKASLRGQSFKPAYSDRVMPDLPDYTPVLEDMNGRVHWLQENVYALPQMIQQTLEQMLAQMNFSPSSIPPNVPPPKARASKEALDRRKERTKNNGW